MAWIIHGHLLVAVATLIGWEHLDVLWPTPILPQGFPVGSEQRTEGLLTLGDPGRPARMASPDSLVGDWHKWLKLDQRQDSAECLSIPKEVRDQLVRDGAKRPDAGGAVHYWVQVRTRRRFGPAQCGSEGGLRINETYVAFDKLRPVSCNRDVFVAHGFVCPGERHAAIRQSQTVADIADYYPEAARLAEAEGKAKVRIERDATGSPTGCRVLASSGVSDLDRQTCKLVGTDPFFTPPPEKPGSPPDTTPITQTVTWRLED